jgi:rhodanese-related sulfurtransferase/peroxiredoxin
MKRILTMLLAALGISLTGCAQNENIKSVSADEFEQQLKGGKMQLLDVRTPAEFAAGHLAGALNINMQDKQFSDLSESLLDKAQPVYVYCRSGHRSMMAATELVKSGFSVVNMKGGILAWQGAGKAVTTEPDKSEKARRLALYEKADSNGYVVSDGDLLPDFTVTLTDGRTLSTKDLRGKVILLQFTASWCPVCRREMPYLERDIWQKHKADPSFVFIGIDRDEPLDKVKAFAQQTAVTYPLALDPGAEVYSKIAVPWSGITRNVLINRDGVIVKRTRLFNEVEFRSLVDEVDKELGK